MPLVECSRDLYVMCLYVAGRQWSCAKGGAGAGRHPALHLLTQVHEHRRADGKVRTMKLTSHFEHIESVNTPMKCLKPWHNGTRLRAIQ